MFRINQLKAGEFIDIDNYYREFEQGDNEHEKEFFAILGVDKPNTQQQYLDFFVEYELQITDIKESFEFIYKPPPLPSTLNKDGNTIGDEYRKEFAEMYGGYVQNIYLVSINFRKLPNEILEMNVIDFLFWANYLLHQKWCEQIK